MKKALAILLALLTLTLPVFSLAESPLTHFSGNCGYTLDYPAELLNVSTYGPTATFFAEGLEDSMSVSVMAFEEPFCNDPVDYLVRIMQSYDIPAVAENITLRKTAAGGGLYSCLIPLNDSFSEECILTENGRMFIISIFMHDSLREKYMPVADAMALSLATDPAGDYSGFAEDIEDRYETDFYTYMIDRFSPMLEKWGTAAWEKWEPEKLYENGITPLLALMDYNADIIHFDFVDLDSDGDYEMVLYTDPADGSAGVNILAVIVRGEDGAFNTLLLSGERDFYTLCGDSEGGYILREDKSDSAYEFGTSFWKMTNRHQLDFIDGIMCTADDDNGQVIWYRCDLGSRSNTDLSVTEDDAMAVIGSYAPCDELDAWIFLSDFMRWDMRLPLPDAE